MKPRRMRTSALVGLDQALSSLSNVLMPLLVAGVTSPSEFGYFLTAYSAFALLLAVSRSSLAVPISMASGSVEDVKREASVAVVTIALAALPLLGVMLGVPLLAGAPWAPAYAFLAVGGLLALMQDNLRYAAVARDKVGLVLSSDAIWLAVICLSIPVRTATSESATAVTALWALGALVSMMVLAAWTLTPLHPRAAVQTWKSQGKARGSLVIGAVSAAASVLVANILIARLAGPSTNAALGGAGQLMAPINILIALLGLALLPAAAKRTARWSRSAFALAGGALAVGSVTWSVAMMLLPYAAGAALLGESWELARKVLPPVGVATAAVAVGAAGAAHMMRLSRESTLARMRLAQGGLRIGLTALVAIMLGTALSLAMAEVLLTVVFAAMVWRLGWSSQLEVRARSQGPS